MKTVTVYGSSDDLIEWDGCEGCDEFYRKGSGLVSGSYLLTTDEAGLRVRAIYDGCWSFAVGQIEEDYPFPEHWLVSTEHGYHNNYSTNLTFEVPDDATLIEE